MNVTLAQWVKAQYALKMVTAIMEMENSELPELIEARNNLMEARRLFAYVINNAEIIGGPE